MRTELIRIYKSLHTWTGILSGMALFICFYAGAITVFKEPLTRWATPPSTAASTPLNKIQYLITETLRVSPEAAKGFSIHLREGEQESGRMTWQVREASSGSHAPKPTRHYVSSLDAAGKLQLIQEQTPQLASFIDVLHRVVGLPIDTDATRWIMGIFAVLYTLALISGVVVLLPSLVKELFAMRVGKNRKRMWLDAHNLVGIISLPFHLVIALTAVVFAYHDGIYALQDHFLHQGRMSSTFQGRKATADTPNVRDPSTMLSPIDLVSRVQQLAPNFKPSLLQYQQVIGPQASVRVWGKDSTAVMPRARGGFAVIDPYTGKIVSTDFLPGLQNAPNLLISSFFALHMAAFGGSPVQWLYFLLGLAGAWLFFSGNLLWIETRRRKAATNGDALPVQRRDVRLLGSLTIGICLGCVCGISFMLAGSKYVYAMTGVIGEWDRTLYYACFFACIAWAIWRGPALASLQLLWAASLLSLAIPLTTLLALIFPTSGLWANTSLSCWGVDITALLGALCFAAMARARARRLREAPANSIWSAHTAGSSALPSRFEK